MSEGSAPADATPAANVSLVRVCPTCRQRFSGDARFCPFDGDPLDVAAHGRQIDPLLGTLIDGRYEVYAVLGEGGMGAVYGVRHRALDKPFALKVMRADLARDAQLAARFIQEAKATAAIGHPNIVQITDFGQLATGSPYFVMELLSGEPLAKLIRRDGPVAAARAVDILRQTASALGAAHAAGVIHRDLKPDNIQVTENDAVKVLDFGVAKMAGAGRLTKTGTVYGTPHYMSPEQASGGTVDHRTDLYALGIIAYEMLTGRVPFEADTYMGILTKHMFMVPERPSQLAGGAVQFGALEDVVMRCLEKKPEARYASADELIAHLESVVHLTADGHLEIDPASAPPSRPGASGQPATGDDAGPPEPRDLRSAGVPPGISRGAVMGTVAALAVGAAAIIFFASRGRSTSQPLSGLVGSALAPAPAPAMASETPAAAVASAFGAERDAEPRAAVAGSAGAGRAKTVRSQMPGRAPARPAPAGGTRAAGGGTDIVNPWTN